MFPSANIFKVIEHSQLSSFQHKHKLDGETADSGSCGMGVIEVVHDIITSARVPPLMQGPLRKKLIVYILT